MYSKRWKHVRLFSMMLCPLTSSSRKVCGERHDAYPPVISSMVYWKTHQWYFEVFPANKTSIWKWFKHILKLHKLHLEICPDFTKPEGTTGGYHLSVLYLSISELAGKCVYIYIHMCCMILRVLSVYLFVAFAESMYTHYEYIAVYT